MSSVTKAGVYYGFAQVLPHDDHQQSLSASDVLVHPMVMSLGWNPFYKNERLSAVRADTLFQIAVIHVTCQTGNTYHARIPIRFLWT
jgi:FAD synthase